MKLLLDTHVVIWALEDAPNLPLKIREMIMDENNEIYVSVISLWEIAIKHKKRPDLLPLSAEEIRYFCQRSGYIFLSLNLDAISSYENIDITKHYDPFDQILVAQSAAHSMRLLTHDDKMKKFDYGFVEVF